MYKPDNFLSSSPPDWTNLDDTGEEISRMFGRHSHYPNWKPGDRRRGQTPFHKFCDKIQELQEGPLRAKRKLIGDFNMDDWGSREFPRDENGLSKTVSDTNSGSVVHNAETAPPNYARQEQLRFRRENYAANKNKRNATPISLQAALARARQLEGKFEQRRQQESAEYIQNSFHARLCADLAEQLKDNAARIIGANKLKQATVVLKLNGEMRKALGIMGRIASDGSNTVKGATTISIQAHYRVMRDICRKAIDLLENINNCNHA